MPKTVALLSACVWGSLRKLRSSWCGPSIVSGGPEAEEMVGGKSRGSDTESSPSSFPDRCAAAAKDMRTSTAVPGPESHVPPMLFMGVDLL
jgi:hypothetical protein